MSTLVRTIEDMGLPTGLDPAARAEADRVALGMIS